MVTNTKEGMGADMQYVLSIDIGASSGRHILGWIENGALKSQEIYRFPNGAVKQNGQLCWDIDALFAHVLTGMKLCGELGKQPVSVGIDTWGVDFALLRGGERLGPVVSYRDARTAGMPELVEHFISPQALYARTGIQKQPFNTVYQLMALKTQTDLLPQADTLLLVPDYLHYLLTGNALCEYTNATTTQLVSAEQCDWDWELIDLLGYPRRIFPPIVPAGKALGEVTASIAAEIGYSTHVIAPATHDTGSAVVSVPSQERHPLYLSSGTWSLMGTELAKPICSEESRRYNLTNEGGYHKRYRYLKNIMGLWMVQSLRRELGEEYSFPQLSAMARENERFPARVDVNDPAFLAPESMAQAVVEVCAREQQPVPQSPGEVLAVVYQSMAQSYANSVRELSQITGLQFDCLHIVGGGCQDRYLNELTQQATGLPVIAGPVEATAFGNLLVQLIAGGQLESMAQARALVRESLEA